MNIVVSKFIAKKFKVIAKIYSGEKHKIIIVTFVIIFFIIIEYFDNIFR